MKTTLERLTEIFEQALEKVLGPGHSYPTPLIIPASNPKFGDYQCNVALPLAKELGRNPKELAEEIVAAVYSLQQE